MTGVAVVFGLCALSFAAGCVLTAVMLRREQPPEPTPQPALAPAPPAPVSEPQFPPGDYATRPIHRNPVMGFPVALPAPERLRSAPRPAPRPNLVVVPDPVPDSGKPVRQDEVRRMHVVRAEPGPPVRADPVEPATAVAGSVELSSVPAEPVAHGEPVEPVAPADPVVRVETVAPAGMVARVESAVPVGTVVPVETAGSAGSAAETAAPVVEPSKPAEPSAEPRVLQVMAQPEPVVARAFEAARRESNR
ncbi:hypothetical protein ACQPYE_34605 [Actinosynnema sp. CA-299493]